NIEERTDDFLGEAIKKQLGKGMLKKLIPYIGWVMTACDVVDAIEEYSELKDELKELKEILGKQKEAIQTFQKYKDKIINFEKLSEKEKNSLANEIMAETQAAYAYANRCL
ncbi:TPA: hypothetical protein NZK23_004922, partial [Citrobacter freundii]|nr:hypothetical protein [Citrobacter freundii]